MIPTNEPTKMRHRANTGVPKDAVTKGQRNNKRPNSPTRSSAGGYQNSPTGPTQPRRRRVYNDDVDGIQAGGDSGCCSGSEASPSTFPSTFRDNQRMAGQQQEASEVCAVAQMRHANGNELNSGNQSEDEVDSAQVARSGSKRNRSRRDKTAHHDSDEEDRLRGTTVTPAFYSNLKSTKEARKNLSESQLDGINNCIERLCRLEQAPPANNIEAAYPDSVALPRGNEENVPTPPMVFVEIKEEPEEQPTGPIGFPSSHEQQVQPKEREVVAEKHSPLQKDEKVVKSSKRKEECRKEGGSRKKKISRSKPLQSDEAKKEVNKKRVAPSTVKDGALKKKKKKKENKPPKIPSGGLKNTDYVSSPASATGTAAAKKRTATTTPLSATEATSAKKKKSSAKKMRSSVDATTDVVMVDATEANPKLKPSKKKSNDVVDMEIDLPVEDAFTHQCCFDRSSIQIEYTPTNELNHCASFSPSAFPAAMPFPVVISPTVEGDCVEMEDAEEDFIADGFNTSDIPSIPASIDVYTAEPASITSTSLAAVPWAETDVKPANASFGSSPATALDQKYSLNSIEETPTIELEDDDDVVSIAGEISAISTCFGSVVSLVDLVDLDDDGSSELALPPLPDCDSVVSSDEEEEEEEKFEGVSSFDDEFVAESEEALPPLPYCDSIVSSDDELDDESEECVPVAAVAAIDNDEEVSVGHRGVAGAANTTSIDGVDDNDDSSSGKSCVHRDLCSPKKLESKFNFEVEAGIIQAASAVVTAAVEGCDFPRIETAVHKNLSSDDEFFSFVSSGECSSVCGSVAATLEDEAENNEACSLQENEIPPCELDLFIALENVATQKQLDEDQESSASAGIDLSVEELGAEDEQEEEAQDLEPFFTSFDNPLFVSCYDHTIFIADRDVSAFEFQVNGDFVAEEEEEDVAIDIDIVAATTTATVDHSATVAATTTATFDHSSDTDDIFEMDISEEECSGTEAFIRAPRRANLSSAVLISAFRKEQEQEQRWLKLAVDEFDNSKTTYRRLHFAAEVQDLYSDAWFGVPVPSAAVAKQQHVDKRKTRGVFSSLKNTLKSVRSVLL